MHLYVRFRRALDLQIDATLIYTYAKYALQLVSLA